MGTTRAYGERLDDTKSLLRVLTYNVNRVSDRLKEGAILEWCVEKSREKYDLICFQLVSKAVLDKICQVFGIQKPSVIFSTLIASAISKGHFIQHKPFICQ